MSGKDDPFGSGGKTVIRPNPGGAMRPDQMRPLPDAAPRPIPQRPQPGGHQATVITPMPAPVPPSQPGPFGSPPPSGPFGAPPPAGGFGSPPPQRGHGLPPGAAESWMIGADLKNNFHVGDQKPAAPTTSTRKIPLEVALNARDAGGYSASNPITAAAAPLLILLGRLRLGIVDMQAVPLMNHVADSIIGFEKKVLEAGVSREDAQVAKYALCGTADDIVQNLPGTDRHV